MATTSLSRRKRCYLFNGEDLEIWAAKILLDIFHSEPKNSPLHGYTIDRKIVRNLIAAGQLPPDCGLYLGTRLGDKITYDHKEFMVGTITDPNRRQLLGLRFHIESVPFDFWMDNSGINFAEEIRSRLYRPPSIYRCDAVSNGARVAEASFVSFLRIIARPATPRSVMAARQISRIPVCLYFDETFVAQNEHAILSGRLQCRSEERGGDSVGERYRQSTGIYAISLGPASHLG